MEYIENLESAKSIAKTNFKNLFDNKYSKFSHKKFLLIFNKSLQFICKLKNQHKDFPQFPYKLNSGKTRLT